MISHAEMLFVLNIPAPYVRIDNSDTESYLRHKKELDMSMEMIDVVNEKGEVIDLAPRDVIHGNNSLLHRVVHLIVVNSHGDILLQKRSMNKDVAPGKWDTSVGGHVNAGESIEEALEREMEEELGFISKEVKFLYTYIHSNPYESELVYTHECLYNGPFRFNKHEIDDVRFWPVQEILENMESDLLSDNFKDEFLRYREFLGFKA
jgi:isopentenyldiphosphate isomerase